MSGLGDITSSYPGVAELTRQLDQEKIAMLSKRVDDLRRQNEQLKNKIFKSENDTHEFVAYFQKEMETKDNTIAKLNDELIRKESEVRVTVKQMQEKAQRELAELSDQTQTTGRQQANHIKALEGDLAALDRFREMRDAHNKAMQDMAATVETKENEHVQAMHDLERKFLTDKGNLQKDLERVIEDAKRQAKVEAHSSLGNEAKRIAGENKRMAKELRFQMQMTTELQKHSKALEDQTVSAARDLAILKENDHEYAKQGNAKSKELKRLREQVAALTKSLKGEVIKCKKEGERARAEVSRELDDRSLDVAGLRQLLVLKNRELRNVRKLSQYILQQRNEVETFFLEALEEAKRRIVSDRQARYRSAVAEYNMRLRDASRNKTKFPKIRDITALEPGPQSCLPTDPDAKVDIASLTWEDKERVLRLLFAKINNVQGCVEAAPEHPLEAASEAAFFMTAAKDVTLADDDPQSGQTFVTQQNRGQRGTKQSSSGFSLNICADRDIGGSSNAAGGQKLDRGGGAMSQGAQNPASEPASPMLVGISHEPQAPLIV